VVPNAESTTWRVDFPLWRLILKWADRACIAIEGVTSIQGPVENVQGKLTLRIPLGAGGARLARCARGVGSIDGEFLQIIIPDSVAEGTGITFHSVVIVDNRNGRLNISLTPLGGQIAKSPEKPAGN
jgi:hypothetical protein